MSAPGRSVTPQRAQRSAASVVAQLAVGASNLWDAIESEKNYKRWEELLRLCEIEWYTDAEFTKDTSPCRDGDLQNIYADAGFRLGLAIGRRRS